MRQLPRLGPRVPHGLACRPPALPPRPPPPRPQCTTDGNGVLDCPGYFGHIELAKPMFHVHFLKTVVKVLRCVSYHNSRIMVAEVRGLRSRGR